MACHLVEATSIRQLKSRLSVVQGAFSVRAQVPAVQRPCLRFIAKLNNFNDLGFLISFWKLACLVLNTIIGPATMQPYQYMVNYRCLMSRNSRRRGCRHDTSEILLLEKRQRALACRGEKVVDIRWGRTE